MDFYRAAPMKKRIANLMIFGLLFAFVADSVDADQFLGRVPLQHETYLGQSEVEGASISWTGEAHSHSLPLLKACSPQHSESTRSDAQRVDEDSPSLPVAVRSTQRTAYLQPDIPPDRFSRFCPSRSPGLYLLSRLNN